jgi:hypothetical protein
MQEVKDFLTKVLTAQSITKEIREEALALRDSLDFCKKKNVGVVDIGYVTYPFKMNNQKNIQLSIKDLQKIESNARMNCHPRPLSKIPHIRALRSFYALDLQQAKDLSEWLLEQGFIEY